MQERYGSKAKAILKPRENENESYVEVMQRLNQHESESNPNATPPECNTKATQK
jgi:hypothetical protein